MRARPEFRNRDETQVAVLDALADRNGEGMTIFEIRAAVDDDIDAIETALGELKEDRLIEVTRDEGELLVTVEQHVIGPNGSEPGEDIFEELRRRFPF